MSKSTLQAAVRQNAYDLARGKGVWAVTGPDVARLSGCSLSTVRQAFRGGTRVMREAIVARAKREDDRAILDNLTPPDPIRDKVLLAAYERAQTHGLHHLRKDDVAAAAGCSAGSVINAFGSMPALVEAVVKRAVALGDRAMMREAVVLRLPEAALVPEDMRT